MPPALEVESHCLLLEFAFGAHVALRGLGNCMRVDRSWKEVATSVVMQILFFSSYDIDGLRVLLRYTPEPNRVERIVQSAFSDHMLMDMCEFRKVAELQRLLQHVRCKNPWPHRVTLGDVADLLVKSVVGGLNVEHRLVQNYLRLHILPGFRCRLPPDSTTLTLKRYLDLDIGNVIPLLQKLYRWSIVDGVSIQMVLSLLMDGLPENQILTLLSLR